MIEALPVGAQVGAPESRCRCGRHTIPANVAEIYSSDYGQTEHHERGRCDAYGCGWHATLAGKTEAGYIIEPKPADAARHCTCTTEETP